MSESMKNILEDRNRSSDILWAFRKLKTVYTNDNVPFLYKHCDVLSDEVLKLVTAQCLSESAPEDHQIMTEKIKLIMEEMRCSHSPTFIRFLGIAFSKLLKHFYSGVYVNEEVVAKLKTVIGNSPVIFVPSHRSYCDFIIMAYVCFAIEIEIPCVAAAIDFSSMNMIGSVLRDCKAFFIRRNFHHDPLYKSIFQRYLQYLIVRGNSPVEFFIEGTRSRTGKALPPKFGLLKTIIETYIDNDVPDIILLPIGISYDRVVEDVLFSYELLGIPKPPESTKTTEITENFMYTSVKFGAP